MSSLHRNPSPKLFPELLIGLVVVLAVTGISSFVQFFLDQQMYKSAMQHYVTGNCVIAVEQFDEIINAFRLVDVDNYVARSYSNKLECELLIMQSTHKKMKKTP